MERSKVYNSRAMRWVAFFTLGVHLLSGAAFAEGLAVCIDRDSHHMAVEYAVQGRCIDPSQADACRTANAQLTVSSAARCGECIDVPLGGKPVLSRGSQVKVSPETRPIAIPFHCVLFGRAVLLTRCPASAFINPPLLISLRTIVLVI